MTRIVLVLTVLALTAPALGTVTITAEKDTRNERKILIGYESDEAVRIRSFALDIIATDGNIIDVNDYSVGDDVGGYGIFPGSFGVAAIDVNVTTGAVDNWAKSGYTPIAPPSHPDALAGVGTSGVTIEMAALYDTAAPSQTSGILCSVTVDDDVTEVCVTANARRNNVLLENGEEVIPAEVCVEIDGDCFPNGPGYERQYADWVASGKPDCWCGNVFWDWVNQCDGDALADHQVIGWRVYSNDLVVLVNNWQKKFGDSGFNPCADFDHAGQVIGWRVYTNDLIILATNWQKKVTQLPNDCPRPE